MIHCQWCNIASQFANIFSSNIISEDSLDPAKQIKQINFLLNKVDKLFVWTCYFPMKVDDLKLKTMFEFEEEYKNIRPLMSPKASADVEDQLNNLHDLKRTLTERRDFLIDKEHNSIVSEGDLLKKQVNND